MVVKQGDSQNDVGLGRVSWHKCIQTTPCHEVLRCREGTESCKNKGTVVARDHHISPAHQPSPFLL